MLKMKNIATIYYTSLVRKRCRRCGKNLVVNHPSSVTANTILKNNVNFNGMKIQGGAWLWSEIISIQVLNV